MNGRFDDVDFKANLELTGLVDESDCGSSTDCERLVKDTGAVPFDKALEAAGFGRFQLILLVIAGFASATDAIEVLCVSFLLPSAQCDLQLTSQHKGWLSASVFIGMMFGSYLWGTLADFVGRRQVIIFSLLMNGLCGFAASFCQEFQTFLLAMLLSGVGVGGSIPVAWTYFAELQTEQHRPAQMCYLSLFWMVGNIFVAALGWIIIPQSTWGYFSPGFTFNSWRIFMLCCSCVAWISSGLTIILPESPLYLLKKGEDKKAWKILRDIYNQNHPNTCQKHPYPVSSLTVEGLDFHRVSAPKHCLLTVFGLVKLLCKKIMYLYKKEYLRSTLILLVYNFCLAFSFYGLWMWFPEMFHRLTVYEASHNGSDTNVCNIPQELVKNSTTPLDSTPCGKAVDTSVFLDSFILAFASLPANLLTIWLMHRLRRFFLSGGMVLSGLSVFLIWAVTNRTHSVLLSALFGALTCLPYNALGVIAPELYPTQVRATAIGIFLVLARCGAILGNLAFGELIDSHCSIPILMIASVLIFSGLLSLGLPKINKMRS